jgi:aryl-alcohol dehydrogenase-like predicted oxidoreductase
MNILDQNLTMRGKPMAEISQQVQLGKTDLFISPMGIGTWAWGDRFFWAYGSTHTDDDVQEAFDICVEAGLNFFDTAAIYGFGHNERVFAKLLTRTDHSLVVASKLFPMPWIITQGSILRGIEASAKRLGRKPIDLYTNHWPIPPLSVEVWMRGLAQAKKEGLIRAMGGSNLNLKLMKRAHHELGKHGEGLASNQVHFSLLHRRPEFNGILEYCLEQGITLIAYSPLGQGLLTGKYRPGASQPKGLMRLGGKKLIQDLQPLLELMGEIGEKHGGKTPAQIAINWVLCKGAVPIVGAKNARQATENVGALGWQLTADEISQLDQASENTQVSFPLENLVDLT